MAAPLLTLKLHQALQAALAAGKTQLVCSLDLQRSTEVVELSSAAWVRAGQRYPYLTACKDRTIYYWTGADFEPVSRYNGSLIKLVPTQWGAPTFEIDGIKMLPTAQHSPYVDAQRKVALIKPAAKQILDCCGGLGYFAACSIAGGASRIVSFEKNPDVVWLRSLNPWSPAIGGALSLTLGDIAQHVLTLEKASFDAILHDPPRFGIAGELYSQAFYVELRRVLRTGGTLFHYIGAPNKISRGRNIANEVATRLRQVGFVTQLAGDGILALKRR